MPKSHPQYPAEFKRRFIELVHGGRNPEEPAQKFEPSAQAIRNWMRRADRYEGRCQDGLTTEERQELQKLRRENKRLRESQMALGMVRRNALGLPAHDPALFRRR
ncbi:MAG: hypothetical protein E6J71_15655 [Deltaproteobacteria bacterium]|nr:MAG: hypothetical protein E6J71_15655 [Deltaproteobacteria bacterium]